MALNITGELPDGTPAVLIKDLRVEYLAPGFGLDLETFKIHPLEQREPSGADRLCLMLLGGVIGYGLALWWTL